MRPPRPVIPSAAGSFASERSCEVEGPAFRRESAELLFENGRFGEKLVESRCRLSRTVESLIEGVPSSEVELEMARGNFMFCRAVLWDCGHNLSDSRLSINDKPESGSNKNPALLGRVRVFRIWDCQYIAANPIPLMKQEQCFVIWDSNTESRSRYKNWRRGWDLNPRYPLRYVRFRGGSFQPLTHLSEVQLSAISRQLSA
jgi:hypothetical protein